MKQTPQYSNTVLHSLLDAYIEGDSDFRQEIRRPIREIYEASVSEACTRALTTESERSNTQDFLVHLQSLESTLRSFYVFRCVASADELCCLNFRCRSPILEPPPSL